MPNNKETAELPPTSRGSASFGSIGMINSVSKLVTKDIEEAIWREHSLAHWGANKNFWALKKKGIGVPLNQIRKIVAKCKICAKFRKVLPRGYWGQPPYSLEPRHTVFMDFV